MFRFDLHVHAAERSACASSYEEAQIQAAIAAGMQGIAFTDHHALVGPARLEELNRMYAPLRIYTGIEVTAETEDWLVLGVHDPCLTRTDWRYRDLARFAREQGGFIALAHPFRYAHSIHADLAACPPDGIEIQSLNTPARYQDEIRELARKLGIALLSNSDSHGASSVGRYFNELPQIPKDDRALVEELCRMKSR